MSNSTNPTLRRLRRADGTDLNVRCRALNPVHGFVRPGGPPRDEARIHVDDYEPVLQLLAECKAITGHCQPYIVVITVRRSDQAVGEEIVEAGSYEEIVGALEKFAIPRLAPEPRSEQSARLVRHFQETRLRFLRDVKPQFDLDLDDDNLDQSKDE